MCFLGSADIEDLGTGESSMKSRWIRGHGLEKADLCHVDVAKELLGHVGLSGSDMHV